MIGSHLGHIFLILIKVIEDILVIEDYQKGRYLFDINSSRPPTRFALTRKGLRS